MNDLSKKREEEKSGAATSGMGKQALERSNYKKLEAYLLLVYQAYLKKETKFEPEIKSSLFRMIKLNQDFPLKIRMIQIDYLDQPNEISEGEWDETKEILFPWEDAEILLPIPGEREKIILGYKEIIRELLQS